MRPSFAFLTSPLAAGAFLLAAGLALAQPACRTPEDVVLADAEALSRGDVPRLLALFREDGRVYSLPTAPERLTGELSASLGTQAQRRETFERFSSRPPERTEVAQTMAFEDLVFAKLRVTSASPPSSAKHLLVAFRITDCRIADLWHLARASGEEEAAREARERVVHELVEANNAGDVERFLSVSLPDVLFFRNTGDPRALGDKPSRFNGDPAGRRQAFLRMFADGRAARVDLLGLMTVGDFVVSRDVAHLPDGRVLDEVSIYRVQGGRITHDWLVVEKAREAKERPPS